MQYRLDKRSGNELSVLGMGCMRFPRSKGSIDMLRSELVILTAIEHGVNYFDTAYLYGGSEEALGKIVERNNLRERIFIASKLPHNKCKSNEDVERFFNTSLQRLRTNYLDYYLLHNVMRVAQWERLAEFGMADWIAQKKADGSIRQMGFSFHGNIAEFRKLLDAYDWDFVQIQYNYANEHYQAGREGLELAAERGLPVIIMEPLLGGRLATGLSKEAAEILTSANPERSHASWGLRWLFDQPEVTVVLSGMNSPEMMLDNCATADETAPGSLTDEEHAAIASACAAFEKSFRVPCTGCNYCMPCPQGISIPSLFAAYNESYSLGWGTGFYHYLISVGAASGNPQLASDCIACGACAKKCPQHIDIPARMVDVRKRLQIPGVKAGIRLARPFLT